MLAYKPFVVSAIPHQSSIRHTTILILIFCTCVRARMRASDRFTATAILEKPELNLELAFVWNRSKVTHHTHSNAEHPIVSQTTRTKEPCTSYRGGDAPVHLTHSSTNSTSHPISPVLFLSLSVCVARSLRLRMLASTASL